MSVEWGRRACARLAAIVLAPAALRSRVGAAVGACALMVGSAFAQTALPSVRIGTAPLLSPSAADGYYGSSTTASNGLGATTRPPEIVALARALRNDPDLIYDFVRNNIEIEWSYGLQKGALGAVLDRSGTAFDQAKLMVDLLREAGHSASYVAGTITLSGPQFADWSGITNASAACQLLSSGGIPASINESTLADCAYGSAAVSTITLSHVWVSATIGGAAYLFDPSYKPHSFQAGIDLNVAAGLTTGQALGEASSPISGMQSGTTEGGVAYVRDLNAEALASRLQAYGTSLDSYVQTHAPAAGIEAIVGGAEIIRFEAPSGGLRQTSLPYTSSAIQHSWSGDIPNQYRTTLQVEVLKDFVDITLPPTNRRRDVIVNRTLYVDEIYGRKLIVEPNFPPSTTAQFVADFFLNLRLTNEAGAGPNLASFSFEDDNARVRAGAVRLTANHPYAAAVSGANGDYMDAIVERSAYLMLPLTIVHGWGQAGPGLAEAWGSRIDTPAPELPNPTGCDTCDAYYFSTTGDGRREQLAVSWLVQASRAAGIHASIARSRYTHHHSLGVVVADSWTPAVDLIAEPPGPQNSPLYFTIADSFDRVDVASAFSLTSASANATDRRAGVHAIAATMEALEGSVAAQIADLPDTTSTATRFEWGNNPPAGEDPSGGYGPRRFYRFDVSNASQAFDLSRVEGLTSSSNDGRTSDGGVEPEIWDGDIAPRRSNLAAAIGQYAAGGFDVIASEDAFLGPGQRGGVQRQLSTYSSHTHAPSQQRGGALVATRYVNGEPVEIAHIVVGHDENAKGGGGGAQAYQQALYDPSVAADVLRSRFVDRSSAVGVDFQNGSVTYVAPAAITVGNGDFPYQLSANLIWRGGNVTSHMFGPNVHTQPQAPWTSNWQNMLSVSASGMEAMGQTDARAAIPAIAAFMAMQDIYRASPSAQREAAAVLAAAWWMRQIAGNVVTVNVGADTRQFLRNASGQWFAPGAGAYATLTQTGTRTPFTERCGRPRWMHVRGWNYAGMSFHVTNAGGDRQNFVHWANNYSTGSLTCARMRGFRMSSWTFPQGVDVNLVYASPGSGHLDRLSEVNNSLGRRIRFVYTPTIDAPLSGFDNGLGGADARATSFTSVTFGPLTTTTIADAAGVQTRAVYPVNGGGRYLLTDVYDDDDTAAPSLRYTYDTLGRVMEARDAVALQGPQAREPYEFRIAPGVRGEREDPQGGRFTVLSGIHDETGAPWRRFIDELGNATNVRFDGRGRMDRYAYPEEDEERIAYDNRNRVTQVTRVSKPGSGLADIVVSASWNDAWNKPASITDARGYRTDFTYVASGNGAGQIATATRPAPSGGTPVGTGTRPVYAFSYGAFGRVATSTDPTGLVVSNAISATNGNVTSTTLDPSSSPHINATTSFTYDAIGDRLTSTDPRGNATSTSYDPMRRPTLVRRHNGGTGAALLAAERTNYNPLGQVTSTEAGTAFSGANVTAWTAREARTYTPTGQVATSTLDPGSAPHVNAVTTNAYDGLDRLETVTDPVGRATFNDYDAAGQLERIVRAYGTALQQDYATYAYTANGQRDWVEDANGNRSDYVYDGFDRLCRLFFPQHAFGAHAANAPAVTPPGVLSCATPAAHATYDYEEYGFDPTGNRTSLTLRSGETIRYNYDNLNRQCFEDMPSHVSNPTACGSAIAGAGAADVFFDYDFAGRRLWAHFGAVSGQGIVYGYDTAGRLASETSTIGASRALTFEYDVASNRTRLHWPGSTPASPTAFTAYTYDALNRVDLVQENGTMTLADYAYDAQARRASIARGNGAVTMLGYDPASRVSSIAHDLAGGAANDHTLGFAYTPASQVSSRTASNDNYAWFTTDVGRSYARNGLNQYTNVSGTNFSYDQRGNLTSDGSRTFAYDLENYLVGINGSGFHLGYDPLGRLRQTDAAGTITEFLYDGDRLVAEYNGAGALTRRYVHGPGIDEPLVWYEGSGLADRRYLIADHQGSIIAESGTSTTRYAYGPYGEPDPANGWTGSRFRYTGQIALSEAGLYHYKARVYDPVLGRFLQTDPVGYDDDVNLYAYARNDPQNNSDPTGRACVENCDLETRRLLNSPEGRRAEIVGATAVAAHGAALVAGFADGPEPGPADVAAQSVATQITRAVTNELKDTLLSSVSEIALNTAIDANGPIERSPPGSGERYNVEDIENERPPAATNTEDSRYQESERSGGEQSTRRQAQTQRANPPPSNRPRRERNLLRYLAELLDKWN